MTFEVSGKTHILFREQWVRPMACPYLIVFSLSSRWLIYSRPFFDDDPYVLEPGGYPNLKAWGAKDPSVCSMHPIKLVSAWHWCLPPSLWGVLPANHSVPSQIE